MKDTLESSTNLVQIGDAACVNWNWNLGRFWDLKAFNQLGRLPPGDDGAVRLTVKDNNNTYFFFRACDLKWKMTPLI